MGLQGGPVEGFSEPFPDVAGGYMNTTLAANCFVRGVDTLTPFGTASFHVQLFDTTLDAQDVILEATAAIPGVSVAVSPQGGGLFDMTPQLIATGADVPGAPFWFSIKKISP